MTKAELIRKLSRRTGVSDTDAKQFFEIFLQQSAYLLNAGEAITIKGFGFFQLKKGKIRNPSIPIEEQLKDTSYSDLIVYTPFEKGSDTDKLIFNIPARKETEYNNLDSYFSLSIGKPVIPLRGVKSNEFFIPPSGNELRRLLESKVENILSQAEINRHYTKGSEFLFVNADSIEASQFEIDWNKEPEEGEEAERRKRSFAWDFGENLSRQIEEESILDVGKEEQPAPAEANLSWDFGADFIEEREPVNTKEDFIAESSEEPAPPAEEKKIPDDSEIDNVKNFKRIQSFTKERTPAEDTESHQKVTWQFGEQPGEKAPEDIFKRYDENIKIETGYTEIPNKRRTYDIELSPGEQERLDNLIKEQESKDEADSGDIAESFYRGENISAEPVVEETETRYYSGGRSVKFFLFIALAVIVFVAAALFFYLRDGGLLKEWIGGSPKTAEKKSVQPVIVNRTYEVPVNYPYPAEPSGTEEKVIKNITSTPAAEVKVNEEIPPAANDISKDKTVEKVPPKSEPVTARGKSVKIKENLFKEGNTYSVQVSSWQSRHKAQKEVDRLKRKGYSVYIEQANLSNRGVWYRVKIGSIKTQAEAEKYLKLNL